MHEAALENENVEVLKFLVSHGADIHAKNGYGNTPLHAAAVSNMNVEVAKFLVDSGADMDAKDNYGNTPLDLAKREDHAEVVEYFCFSIQRFAH